LSKERHGGIETGGLIDHHCHTVTNAELDRDGLERYLTEAHVGAPGISRFDSLLGASVLRWCAPLLDLEPHVGPEEYTGRRCELGPSEVNRRFLSACGTTDLLVDSGFQPADPLDADSLALASGARVHNVLRLETLAEEVSEGCAPEDFPEAFRSSLHELAAEAIALKSIVAYRGGFGFDPRAPTDADVVEAARHWLKQSELQGRRRLSDPVILRFVLWSAAGLAHRLQLHAGLGDPDLRLHRADPSLSSDFFEAIEHTGTTVLLLHCWPYHRQAAFLSAVYPHVYLDVGLALNFAGPRASAVLAETMELAPFAKLLYSSDAFGLAELHYLGALRFSMALERVVGEWVTEGELAPAYAASVRALVSAGNARRVYGLDEPGGERHG
jgi:uncharacterized protein